MKSFLAKLRISNALDVRKPLPPASRRTIPSTKDERQFAEISSALDTALRASKPEPQVPASLHTSIMRAIRSGVSSQTQSRQIPWLRSFAAPSLALLALFAVLWFNHKSSRVKTVSTVAERQPLQAASSALELAGNTLESAPTAAMAPLADEMQRLSLDVDNARQFLLASFP
ncbi:MAG: hypothetical protein JWR26_24 [Pedosphaera sp.]|nr:hypothetical protein [Pedosphaera sp.]